MQLLINDMHSGIYDVEITRSTGLLVGLGLTLSSDWFICLWCDHEMGAWLVTGLSCILPREHRT